MAEVNQQLSRNARQGRRWGVLLAGGDGTRLKNLTRIVSGDDRPKQFCSLFGDDSLLDLARKRAERTIYPEQILVQLTASHRAFYVEEPGVRASQRIVQPTNRGTAPPILYSLLSIEQIDDDAIVAVLPSDQYFSDERGFSTVLESAFETAAQYPWSVILLGASPQGPEVEYGWIETGPPVHTTGDTCSRVLGVRRKAAALRGQRATCAGLSLEHICDGGTCSGFLGVGTGVARRVTETPSRNSFVGWRGGAS